MLKKTPQIESELALAVRELRDEVKTMREVLSELAQATIWQNNNAEDYPSLVHDRSALWTLTDAKLPKLLEKLSGVPPLPMPDAKAADTKSQRDLF